MKIISALLAVCLFVGINEANAQKKKAGLIKATEGQGYGLAGCGLGSAVFGEQKGMVQIFAATTNGTSMNNTFGMTFGSLNCGEGSKLVKAEQYIETNKVALENDMARGQGETLTSLSQVLECKNQDFSSTMKNNYRESFPQGGATAGEVSAVAYKSCQI